MRKPITDLPAGPPQDRLWTEDDLAFFFGFRSVGELISRHPDFPNPVPLQMKGRRWRPIDVIAWVDNLCDDDGRGRITDGENLDLIEVPALEMDTITELLQEASNGTTR